MSYIESAQWLNRAIFIHSRVGINKKKYIFHDFKSHICLRSLGECIICIISLKHVLSPSHYQNKFMATGALGHTHVRLHVLGIQDPNKAQVNTRATMIIIHTNIYTHTHIYINIYIDIAANAYIYRYYDINYIKKKNKSM